MTFIYKFCTTVPARSCCELVVPKVVVPLTSGRFFKRAQKDSGDELEWRRETQKTVVLREYEPKQEEKSLCSLIQFIIFFEVALTSWTWKHLSVYDGLKKYFCRIVIACKISETACESRSVWLDYEFIRFGLCRTLSWQPALIILFSFITIVVIFIVLRVLIYVHELLITQLFVYF